MNTRTVALSILASGVALGAFAAPALAQSAPDITSANAPAGDDEGGRAIIVTGSRIKQDPSKSALPLTIITNEDLKQNAISSPEQLTMFLPSNGSGADNLASNSDVTTGAQRGTNGLSAANLRGQGSAATLVLLNGRRVAAHGLSGSAVDVNQIPFAAIDRVEILKDGASAIYGTDAIGGVINYITKKNYTGIGLQGFTDFTEQSGGNIYNLSGIAGYGDLKSQGFNVMAAVSMRWNEARGLLKSACELGCQLSILNAEGRCVFAEPADEAGGTPVGGPPGRERTQTVRREVFHGGDRLALIVARLPVCDTPPRADSARYLPPCTHRSACRSSTSSTTRRWCATRSAGCCAPGGCCRRVSPAPRPSRRCSMRSRRRRSPSGRSRRAVFCWTCACPA